jgi:hypothetical protein
VIRLVVGGGDEVSVTTPSEIIPYYHLHHSIWLLMVNSCIKVRLDLQADKSPVVVKGPFFPQVVNPRYRIRGTNV